MSNALSNFFDQPERMQDTWTRVVHAISRMRADRVSLQQAAREFGISPKEVIRLGGSALRKTPSGRYVAKATDDLLRVLSLPGTRGLREIAVDESREASIVGKYWDAVRLYLQTGDASGLREFRGKSVWDADGRRVGLLTDLDELDRQGSAGVLSFESIYARSV
jgi:hypothetical protein